MLGLSSKRIILIFLKRFENTHLENVMDIDIGREFKNILLILKDLSSDQSIGNAFEPLLVI